MATFLKIPLLAETSDQVVYVELDGNPYVIRVLWNERFGYFSLSISEADQTPILVNIKMVKNFPLTRRFQDLRLPFGSLFFVQEKGNAARPGYSDLATNCNLYYIEPDTVITAQQVHEQVSTPLLGTIWDSGFTTWDTGETLWDQ